MSATSKIGIMQEKDTCRHNIIKDSYVFSIEYCYMPINISQNTVFIAGVMHALFTERIHGDEFFHFDVFTLEIYRVYYSLWYVCVCARVYVFSRYT